MKNKRRLGVIVAGMICLSVLGTIVVRKAVIPIVSEYLKSRTESSIINTQYPKKDEKCDYGIDLQREVSCRMGLYKKVNIKIPFTK